MIAEENVPASTRTDEQLVLVKERLPIRKSNLLMDLQKKQKNPIFLISVDILQNTNFFRAFTASADIPSIYVQQFWNTLGKDDKTGEYSFQLDELWFNLNVDLLRNALKIALKDSAHPFVPPLAGDLVIDFLNNLGYPKELQFVSKMHVNNLYQPWRTILSMINQCLTGKTSGSDKSRYPALQMLWGVVTGTNLIINHLGGRHNIHIRPQSPVHITADDYQLDNLKFVSKGGVDEVFGMPIPKDVITDAIRNLEYYKKYLDMVARKPRQPTTVTDEEVGKKKKAPEAGKSKQHAPAKQHKSTEKKSSKPTTSKKIRKGKRYDHLVTKRMKKVNLILNLKRKMMNTISK
ncbi:hypothetical protein Tco_0493395 [Tanacetum coccineum]